MDGWAWRTLAVATLLAACVCPSFGKDITYTIREEESPGTFIGNIAVDANLSSIVGVEDLPMLHYRILEVGNPDSVFFDINSTTGDLLMASRLDREVVCLFTLDCVLSLEVAVQSSGSQTFSFFRNFKVSVVVLDVNDNLPLFAQNATAIEILESVIVGASFSLDGAVDRDTGGNNSLQGYRVLPPDSPFEATMTKNLDGTSVLNLIVVKPLDRERLDFYSLELVAYDGGDPPRSSSLTVNVTVLDVNDEAPVFSKTRYLVTIGEDAPINTVIYQVSAEDMDQGENGRVYYRLSRHQKPAIMEQFSIDIRSGAITLKQPLASGTHTVYVEASNSETGTGSGSMTSQAILEVEVLDTDNSPPSITVNPLLGTDVAHVPESANVGLPVAHVAVSDPDSGRNGIVECVSWTPDFSLQPLDTFEYKVVVATPLDRETVSRYEVTVFCEDKGTPVLNATQVFTVVVDDINDHAPRFLPPDVNASIAENNSPGETIVQVVAIDEDAGNNANLTYTLEPAAVSLFAVDSRTGLIRARRRFDREDVDKYVLHVVAADQGLPPKVATATVTVTILDVNDEPPQFDLLDYFFRVYEDIPVGTVVGNVSATDRDSGRGGLFTMSPHSPRMGEDVFPFVVANNGTIYTKKKLDRERFPEIVFDIFATDLGTPDYSGKTRVTVEVEDVNDNDPVILFPDDVNNSIEVFLPIEANKGMASVRAEDRDSGFNAKLTYSIKDQNSSRDFRIDPQTGEIFTLRDYDVTSLGVYDLEVLVSDMGNPPRTSNQTLRIVLKYEPGGVIMNDYDMNIIIVVSLITATVIISVVVITTLCVIRKMDRERQVKYRVEDIDMELPPNNGTQNPVMNPEDSDRHPEKGQGFDMPDSKKDLSTTPRDVMPQLHTTPRNPEHYPPDGVPGPSSGGTGGGAVQENGHDGIASDQDQQKLHQLTSLKIHQVLERLHSTRSQNHSLLAEVKVRNWREAMRRAEDMAASSTGDTTTGDTTTGDSGHGSDEDMAHLHLDRADRSLSFPRKIRLGVRDIRQHSHSGASSPFRPSLGSQTFCYSQGSKPVYVSKPSLPYSYGDASPRDSPRSDTVDGDDTTTSGSYSVTLEDTRPEYQELTELAEVSDVFV